MAGTGVVVDFRGEAEGCAEPEARARRFGHGHPVNVLIFC